jgi:Cu(I)-responsive transcriptional regulator
MNIGEAAARSGVSAKMIRHYESLGILAAADRRENGYRDYDEAAVAALRFIRRARDLGFPLADAAALLALRQDERRASRTVKALAENHVATLERRMVDMAAMIEALRELAAACPGDDAHACPIIDGLDRDAAG